ncbi:CLIP-associating protein 2 [Hypsibius exemplaris]|uniref:CLIP-associating protein 2 n=1 Tax=Hypsibius exemplaris TaxID=2072580 RepID=A0A1W0X2Q8_HYPEX|nr:CLIP-associating protein 2 [Hypsibius exemplaris]
MARTEAKTKGLQRDDNSDEPDLIKGAFMKSGSRAQSVPPKSRNVFGANAKSASKESGAVDEAQFREAFADYTPVVIGSAHELEAELKKINIILANEKEDWEKRVEQLRRLRGVVVAGGANYKEFAAAFRYLDLSLEVCVKDLRSQVVREGCITIAYLAETQELRCERTAEMNLPALLQLISNSVKIMATSGAVCIRMILTYVHSHKLVPIITKEYLASKSKEIRRACCEFICLFLAKFPKTALDRHTATIQEAIKKGMADADSDARSLARQAYIGFAGHFPALANALYKELDLPKQRMLDEMVPRSDSQSSLHSLTSNGPSARAATAVKKIPHADNLGVSCALRMGQDQVEGRPEVKNRSSSAIDMAAARRAKAKVTPMLNRTLRPPTSTTARNGVGAGPPVVTRGRPPPTQSFAKSQPGSRSSSPSNPRYPQTNLAASSKRTPGNAAASRDHSRDPSPSGRSAVKSAYKAPTARGGVIHGARRPGAHEISLSRKGSQDASHYSDDESETSSIGSEHSAFGRSQMAGTSIRDNLSEILQQLSSGNWTTKRDGLLGLQRYIVRDGLPLSHMELEHVSAIFTRMFNDPTTKVIGIFLDTLYDFVRVYKLDLGTWLYTLLTKLLSKQGAELVPTVQTRIEKLFELIRASFPTDIQFQHLIRFITDQNQTPNVRVKAAVLTYMITLVQNHMRPEDLRNSSASRLGLTRIINWSLDGKIPEIRKNAQQVLIVLRQLNEHEFSALLDTLDEYLRDSANKLMNGYNRRPSGLSDEFAAVATPPKNPPTATKPVSSASRQFRERALLTPLSSPSQTSSGNEENLNPDAVLRNLRQTSQDIQKYGYASADSRRPAQSRQQSEPPPSLSGSNDVFPAYNDHSVVPVYATSTEQIVYLTTLTERMAASTDEKQYTVLRHLDRYLPLICDEVWDEHFMTVLPFLFENFQSPRSDTVSWALQCFGQLLRLQPDRMRMYPELTLVNIIEVQKNPSKQVVKAAEDCAYMAARTFPCEMAANILVPIMNNQPHPENAAAVRLFSFMAQQVAREELVPVLPIVMPSLVTGFNDNRESKMRKECVDALIYSQMKVGEDLMTPYLELLPASKMRLMKLYYKRIVEPDAADTVEAEYSQNGTPNKSNGSDTPV